MSSLRERNGKRRKSISSLLLRALQNDRSGQLDFRRLPNFKKKRRRRRKRGIRASRGFRKRMKNRLCLMYATAFYIGFIPGAPGTYGSLATVLVYSAIYHFSGRILPALHLSAICLISLAGILASAEVSRSSGQEDPPLCSNRRSCRAVADISFFAGQLAEPHFRIPGFPDIRHVEALPYPETGISGRRGGHHGR